MEDFNINSTITSDYEYDEEYYTKLFIFEVMIYIILSISIPLTLVAIYALYCQVRNDEVAPIYIINLLISDLIQLCSIIVLVARPKYWSIIASFYEFGVAVSVCFMVLIAMERYLVIACPLWYRFRRTIKLSVVICVSVWVIALVCTFTLRYWYYENIISGIFLLLPLPLFIFFLGGTIRALSASTLPSDEKRRIVAILVLVLLIYMLLLLPIAILLLQSGSFVDLTHSLLSHVLLFLSPLADLFLYVFMRKGVIEKLLASVCCCKMDSNDVSSSTV